MITPAVLFRYAEIPDSISRKISCGLYGVPRLCSSLAQGSGVERQKSYTSLVFGPKLNHRFNITQSNLKNEDTLAGERNLDTVKILAHGPVLTLIQPCSQDRITFGPSDVV